uniref:Uncharacterized protein n=1 Tax=Setaria digitata TaxID=48799 RepID=A0A915PJ35_9BILA
MYNKSCPDNSTPECSGPDGSSSVSIRGPDLMNDSSQQLSLILFLEIEICGIRKSSFAQYRMGMKSVEQAIDLKILSRNDETVRKYFNLEKVLLVAPIVSAEGEQGTGDTNVD